MRRFFTEPHNIKGDLAYIFEDSKHIERVLRMNCGDKVLVFDGSGYEYTAELIAIEKSQCTAKILSKEQSHSEPDCRIVLFQGLPKSGKMELIIQKAVELGVSEVIPVMMERSVTKIANKAAGVEKALRWNKISVEAAKQCGRGRIPKVHEPVDFETAIEMLKGLQVSIMPYEELGHQGRTDLKGLLEKNSSATEFGIIVGPEGGFSEAEAAYAMSNKINTVGLGKRILRTETVSGAIIPVIMFFKNEF